MTVLQCRQDHPAPFFISRMIEEGLLKEYWDHCRRDGGEMERRLGGSSGVPVHGLAITESTSYLGMRSDQRFATFIRRKDIYIEVCGTIYSGKVKTFAQRSRVS